MMREVESFVIRLYSSLDILSRLLCELQNVPDTFESFRKIPSDKKALYSTYRRKSLYADDSDLIFCDFSEVAYLEDLRNEIVHNRAFESAAKCYVRLEESVIKERFSFYRILTLVEGLRSGKGAPGFIRKRRKEIDTSLNFTLRYLHEWLGHFAVPPETYRMKSRRDVPMVGSRRLTPG